MCRQLQEPIQEVLTQKAVTHQLNEHEDFNGLLAALRVWGCVRNTQDAYTLDYDGHILQNTKPDNACTYQHTQGYYPVVCSIKKLPLYVQNRKGNTPEGYGQPDVIKKAIAGCREQRACT